MTSLGLIVLRVDETIEHEFREFIPPETARLHVTRIHSGDDLTPETIGAMKASLTEAAALLPPAADFDVVGYACTSGAAHLGSETIARLVKAGVPTRTVTEPLSAAVAQMQALDIHQIGIVSPYTDAVANTLHDAFRTRGINIEDTVSFNESDEGTVARIDPLQIAHAARMLARRSRLDGVFLSCTNLQTAGILESLAAELKMPVLSSNHALAWHMKRLAGLS
ncbi:MAG: aspartate/glutamate racemase family protein [Paracoccaceae bacterium]|nr:aspartate/glutamate racemase family protein [Paracoccaceae bacterium]